MSRGPAKRHGRIYFVYFPLKNRFQHVHIIATRIFKKFAYSLTWPILKIAVQAFATDVLLLPRIGTHYVCIGNYQGGWALKPYEFRSAIALCGTVKHRGLIGGASGHAHYSIPFRPTYRELQRGKNAESGVGQGTLLGFHIVALSVGCDGLLFASDCG